MSTCYRFEPAVSLAEFKAVFPRLESEFGIRAVDVPQDDGKTATMLTDGKHYIEFYSGDGTDVGLERWGANNADVFENALDEIFDDRTLLSEHDEGFFTEDDLTDEEE